MTLNRYSQNKNTFRFTISFNNRDDAGYLIPRIRNKFGLKFNMEDKNKLTFYFELPLNEMDIYKSIQYIAKKRRNLLRDALDYFPD